MALAMDIKRIFLGELMTKRMQTEAERFKEFARKLVSVPKEEIDKKAEEYHKKRIAERKAARNTSNKRGAS